MVPFHTAAFVGDGGSGAAVVVDETIIFDEQRITMEVVTVAARAPPMTHEEGQMNRQEEEHHMAQQLDALGWVKVSQAGRSNTCGLSWLHRAKMGPCTEAVVWWWWLVLQIRVDIRDVLPRAHNTICRWVTAAVLLSVILALLY